MNKDKEFLREIKIDKKRRLRYNLLTLIIFNVIFLSSLIYMCALIHNIFAGIIAILLFVLIVVGSVFTMIKSRNNRRYVVYRDKISIESTTYKGEIDLSKVFMVKAKRNIFEILFRKCAHLLVVYAKNDAKEAYMLPFIGEDVELLADNIMKLAIQARESKKNNKVEQNVKISHDNLINKKIKLKKSNKNNEKI